MNILGTELNGDCLMTTLSIVAIYATICWNENDTLKNILAIAFSLSFAILAKSSAVMLSPAIGLVFILHFFKGEKTKKEYIKQFIIFLIICGIIAPAWLLRNYILFDLPFSYVPGAGGTSSTQYIGYLSMLDRLSFPTQTQLQSVAINFDLPEEYANIWGQTIITELFDEGILVFNDENYIKYGIILLRSTLLFHVIEIVALCFVIRNIFIEKELIKKGINILFSVSVIGIMYSYVTFCFQYPYICTMSARYIAVPLTMLSLVLASGFENISNGICRRIIGIISLIIVAIVSFLSAFLYYTCAV